ncbi:MAG: hypothetical protein Q4P34_00385 [Tissierellia bacterium]|nr:hypothetical protein [Tissierellia bacterium]
MIKENKMILIGSTGRNSGKTTLACSLIEKYKMKYNIIGLKVTTISSRSAKCPRGGEGCGVCTSITGDYDIKFEKKRNSDKDTVRLLNSGCEEVYWIRAHRDSLSKAYEEFMEISKGYDIIICESNSLRHIVEPAVFIMIKNTDDELMKPTSREVIGYADIIIGSCDEDEAERISDLINIDKTGVYYERENEDPRKGYN